MAEATVGEEIATSEHSLGAENAQEAKDRKVVVSATFTAEPIEEPLRF